MSCEGGRPGISKPLPPVYLYLYVLMPPCLSKYWLLGLAFKAWHNPGLAYLSHLLSPCCTPDTLKQSLPTVPVVTCLVTFSTHPLKPCAASSRKGSVCAVSRCLRISARLSAPCATLSAHHKAGTKPLSKLPATFYPSNNPR